MKKRVIALDIDDVLIHFYNGIVRYHNALYGTAHKRGDMVTYQFEKLWNCPREEMVRRVMEYYRSKEHEQVEAIEGVHAVLTRYKKKFTYVCITARPESVRVDTLPILERYFPKLITSAHFLGHLELGTANCKSKAEVCHEIGAMLLVEDSLHNGDVAARAGIQVLLIDTPWNQTPSLHPLIRRVFNWSEIDTVFASL